MFSPSYDLDKIRWCYPLICAILLAIAIVMAILNFIGNMSEPRDASRSLLVIPVICHHAATAFGVYFHNGVKVYNDLSDIVDDFVEKAEVNPKFKQILVEHLIVLGFWFWIYFVLIFLIDLMPVGVAIFMSYYKDDYIYMIPMLIPGIDSNSTLGFAINQITMTWIAIVDYMGLNLVSFGTFLLFIMSVPMVKIFILKFKELGTDVRDLEEMKNLNLYENQDEKEEDEQENNLIEKIRMKELEIERNIKDLIEEFQTYSEYIDGLQSYNELITLTKISVYSIGIGVACLCALTYSAPVGISIIIGYGIEVAFVCVQGAIITHLKEKILVELWRFPWYDLSPKMKKIYLQFLHRCQNSPEIEIPIFGKLNMEIFTNVVNGSYSLFNFFLNFVKY